MSDPCERCGEGVDREAPSGNTPRWLRDAIDRAPVFCAECIDRAEREREGEAAEQLATWQDTLACRWRAESGLPERLRFLHLADRDPRRHDALEAARRWATGELPGLALLGEIGVGKTHLAAAAAWRRLMFAPLRWFSVPVLFAHLKLPFDNRLHEAAVATLVGTGALVLDDLDKVRATEYAAEQIFAAVDQRVTAGAALLITSNLRLSELADRWPDPFGVAIVDRLASYCESFYLEGESRRQLGGLG